MSTSTLLVEEEECGGLPVCGANLSSPVVDQANYIREIRYKVGSKILGRLEIIAILYIFFSYLCK